MESECNCPGCGKTFDDPRVLPCKHVYCAKCIAIMSRALVDLIDPSKGTKSCCFLCDAEFTLLGDNIQNLAKSAERLTLIEKYQSQQGFFVHMCDEHTDEEAKARCLSGCGHICGDCLSAHKTLRVLRKHQLEEVNFSSSVVFESTCPVHSQPLLEVCSNEKIENPFLCGVCLGQHLKDFGPHPHDDYEAGTRRICSKLEENQKNIATVEKRVATNLKKLEEKNAEIEKYVHDLKRKASDKFDRERNLINEEEKRFMEKIDRFHQSIQIPYIAMGEFLEAMKSHLDYSSKLIGDALSVFKDGKSPLKLPLARMTSEKIMLKKIPQVPESYEKFSQSVEIQAQFVKPYTEAIGRMNELVSKIGENAGAINSSKNKDCPEYEILLELSNELLCLSRNTYPNQRDKIFTESLWKKLFSIVRTV